MLIYFNIAIFSAIGYNKCMNDVIINFFKKNCIDQYAHIPLDSCRIKKEYLIKREVPDAKSVYVFLVPYYCGNDGERTVSLYAISRDYHLFFRTLFDGLTAELKNAFPGESFAGFSDHSPVFEVEAAASAGLGVIGDNGLLINEKYGSFVFIGEILTSEDCGNRSIPISECSHCGRCKALCPCAGNMENCLSAITQKKGELSEFEIGMIRKYGSVWGCDICQLCCPMNSDINETPIKFFRENRIASPEYDFIRDMPENEFYERAFSWRGKECILRNIDIVRGV